MTNTKIRNAYQIISEISQVDEEARCIKASGESVTKKNEKKDVSKQGVSKRMVVARVEREEEEKEKERKSIIKLYRQERSSLGGERKKK